jgi:plastocyanin
MTTTETDAPGAEPEDPTADAPAAETPAASPPSDGAPPAESLALEAAPDPNRDALWTRAILPLALPLLAALAIAMWVVNLSRAFLAGGETGALVIVLIVTFSIMIGASLVSVASHMRTSSKMLLVAALIAVISAAGIISFGPSEEKNAAAGGGYKAPTGKPVQTLTVDALPSLKFQSKAFTLKAGVTKIDYSSKGGPHNLSFDTPDANLVKFQLNVPPDGTGNVDLQPGTYTIYCNIPGHRASGMEATITVTK